MRSYGSSASNLSRQLHRPVVRLLNQFDALMDQVDVIAVEYGVHCFTVDSWNYSDAVSFGQQTYDPEVYLYRELKLSLRLNKLPVVLWISDELNMEQPPAMLSPEYGEEWQCRDRAELRLLFGAEMAENDLSEWLDIPLNRLGLRVNGQLLRA